MKNTVCLSRSKSVFIAAATMVLLPFVSNASDVLQADFSTYELGSLQGQGNWVLENGNSTASQIVANPFAGKTGNILRLAAPTSGSASSWIAHALVLPEDVATLDISVKAGGIGNARRSLNLTFSSGNNPWDTSPFAVRTIANDSTGWVEVFSYMSAAGTWVNSDVVMTANVLWDIQLSVDLVNRVYDFYATPDGGERILIQKNIEMNPTVLANPQWLQLRRAYADGMYVGDISITAQAIPEASTLAMIAMLVPLALLLRVRLKRRG